MKTIKTYPIRCIQCSGVDVSVQRVGDAIGEYKRMYVCKECGAHGKLQHWQNLQDMPPLISDLLIVAITDHAEDKPVVLPPALVQRIITTFSAADPSSARAAQALAKQPATESAA